MNKKYANCGASVPPAGKKAKMYGGGMAMKKNKKPSYNMGGMAEKKKSGMVTGNMGIKNR